MLKINKLPMVILFLASMFFTGCGMIPVAGILVDEQSPTIFFVNSVDYPRITNNLSKKITLVTNPEQADFLVYVLACPVSIIVDIIAKNGQANEINYQPIMGDISPLICSGIIRTIQLMPRKTRQFKLTTTNEVSI